MTPVTRADGPKNPLIMGHLRPFRRDPLNFLTRLTARYGDIVYFRVGTQHIYLVNHPNLVRDVLVTKQSKFIKSRMLQRARVLLGDGLLTSEGALHLRQRRLVQPAFHQARLAHYADEMTACTLRARERWRDGEVFDVASEMTRLTLAIVGMTLFSTDIEAEATEIGQAMNAIMRVFEFMILPFSEYLEKLRLPPIRRFEKARDRLDRTIYSLITERRASGEDRGDLLSMLLLAQDEEDGAGMPDRQVRDEALTLFIAGHETTAVALTWAWYLLSLNPECEARLHEEIGRVLQGRAPGFNDLPNLPYTEAVFAETLRLYPPAWAIGRMTVENVEIGGVEIPARSICLLSPYTMHRDPRYWEDPERFDPGRWTQEARAARPKFAYYPFGGGTRVCVGERFAWMEGVLVLATLAQKWRLRLEPGPPVETMPVLTLRTRNGIRMRVMER